MRFYEKKRGCKGEYGENTGGMDGYNGLVANRLRIGKELDDRFYPRARLAFLRRLAKSR